MRDYEAMIDSRISKLQSELDKAYQDMESKIDMTMEEFIYREAIKSLAINEEVNAPKLMAEQAAKEYRELAKNHTAKINALKAFKERLKDPQVVKSISDELSRLGSQTYPRKSQ